MVNKANMLLWVRALQSDRFAQGKGALKMTRMGSTTYCCLGVACEIARENGVILRERTDELGSIWFDERHGVLPKTVLEWLGLDAANPFITESLDAVSANDDEPGNMSFREIGQHLIDYYKLEQPDGTAE